MKCPYDNPQTNARISPKRKEEKRHNNLNDSNYY